MKDLYTTYKEKEISGRYFPNNALEKVLRKYETIFQMKTIGFSETGKTISSVLVGKGDFKVLIWSQMHGNETTTTKAILDLLCFFSDKGIEQTKFLNYFTFLIIPQLNPDGATSYTRENANQVDLNRDAALQSQSEMQALFAVFNKFEPHLCLNMHDQRTIFSSGETSHPATISLLAPSADPSKSLTKSRIQAMGYIVGIYTGLQNHLKNQIGRFDDSFNENCIGDAFQSRNVPTILIEAGHYPGDYQREETRMYVFYTLYILFSNILENKTAPSYENYFSIPENGSRLRDVVITNARLQNFNKPVTIVLQFEEKLESGFIVFLAKIIYIGTDNLYIGHKMIDAEYQVVENSEKSLLSENQYVKKITINNKEFSFF